jgi:hypothetical protein
MSDRPLSFAGRPSALIKSGGELVSDPVALAVGVSQRVAISVFLPHPTGLATEHAQAKQVNYVASGDRALDEGGGAFTDETRPGT